MLQLQVQLARWLHAALSGGDRPRMTMPAAAALSIKAQATARLLKKHRPSSAGAGGECHV